MIVDPKTEVMSRSALLVIDPLIDFFRNEPLSGRLSELATAINHLVLGFRKSDQPIIWVRQEFHSDLSDAFLEMRRENIRITIAGTEGARILPELDVQSNDTVIIKKRYSAFFQTALDEVLGKLRPEILVVGGVNTHACVSGRPSSTRTSAIMTSSWHQSARPRTTRNTTKSPSGISTIGLLGSVPVPKFSGWCPQISQPANQRLKRTAGKRGRLAAGR